MYDNKFETKENIFLTEDKMENNLGLWNDTSFHIIISTGRAKLNVTRAIYILLVKSN